MKLRQTHKLQEDSLVVVPGLRLTSQRSSVHIPVTLTSALHLSIPSALAAPSAPDRHFFGFASGRARTHRVPVAPSTAFLAPVDIIFSALAADNDIGHAVLGGVDL